MDLRQNARCSNMGDSDIQAQSNIHVFSTEWCLGYQLRRLCLRSKPDEAFVVSCLFPLYTCGSQHFVCCHELLDMCHSTYFQDSKLWKEPRSPRKLGNEHSYSHLRTRSTAQAPLHVYGDAPPCAWRTWHEYFAEGSRGQYLLVATENSLKRMA